LRRGPPMLAPAPFGGGRESSLLPLRRRIVHFRHGP
jgi:hypothetical protein